MRAAALVAIACLLAGCVTTTLQPGAAAVRVTTNPDVIASCSYVGQVKASDRMNGGLLGQDAAEENTHRRLQNRAHAMGGNAVFVNSSAADLSGARARGEVYSCS
jgi:hypothetical protein